MKRVWVLLGIGVFVMFGSIGSLVFGQAYQDGGAAYRCREECDEKVRLTIPHTAPEFQQAVDECVVKNPNCPEHAKRFSLDNMKNRSKKPQQDRQWTELDKQMLRMQKCSAECRKQVGDSQPTTPAAARAYHRALKECSDECERKQR